MECAYDSFIDLKRSRSNRIQNLKCEREGPIIGDLLVVYRRMFTRRIIVFFQSMTNERPKSKHDRPPITWHRQSKVKKKKAMFSVVYPLLPRKRMWEHRQSPMELLRETARGTRSHLIEPCFDWLKILPTASFLTDWLGYDISWNAHQSRSSTWGRASGGMRTYGTVSGWEGIIWRWPTSQMRLNLTNPTHFCERFELSSEAMVILLSSCVVVSPSWADILHAFFFWTINKHAIYF